MPLIGLVKLLAYFPVFVTTFFSNGCYVYTSKLLRFTLGWIPFSFGDILYALSVFYIARWLILNRKRFINETKNIGLEILAFVSIIYLAFHVFWGFNYYRLPLHKHLNLKAEYTSEELISITKKLIIKSNDSHRKLVDNDSVKITIPYSKETIIQKTVQGYSHLKTAYEFLSYNPKSVKKSMLSWPLTYMGFSGYFNPLTNEAQINALIPVYKFPTTTAHEIAHQLGYAAENEANFIGFLATINNNDDYFKYSGYTFGLKYCLNEVYKRDPLSYNSLIKTVNRGILKNYEEVKMFWQDYKNPTEPLFKKSYNTFLQANNQKGGMKSYSYVVALIVNYFNDNSI